MSEGLGSQARTEGGGRARFSSALSGWKSSVIISIYMLSQVRINVMNSMHVICIVVKMM